MTRAEHLAWAKERALAYLPADPGNAIASFVSDMGKHEDLRAHVGLTILGMLMMNGHLRTAEEIRRNIEGFN